MTAGYSGTPLVKKLGIKPDTTVVLIGAPADYLSTLGELPSGVTIAEQPVFPAHFIQLFAWSRAELESLMADARPKLAPNGSLWVSWPKKASGVQSDVTEDVVREVAFAAGLVDVKVCAVDEIWSGLKLVVPLKDRPR